MSEIEAPSASENTEAWPQEWWKTFFVADHVRFQIDLSEQAHDSDAEACLLVRLADIGRGSRVLDVPCGQGRHAVRLAQAGAAVTGLDASDVMIRRAKREAEDRGANITWVCGDMRDISLESEFDCIACLGGSFGYLGSAGDSAFLAAIRRALKPGGKFVLDVPSFDYISANHRPFDRSVVGGRNVAQYRDLDTERRVARIRVAIETTGGSVSRTYHQRLYTSAELASMLAVVGFAEVKFLESADFAEYRSNKGHQLVIAS